MNTCFRTSDRIVEFREPYYAFINGIGNTPNIFVKIRSEYYTRLQIIQLPSWRFSTSLVVQTMC